MCSFVHLKTRGLVLFRWNLSSYKGDITKHDTTSALPSKVLSLAPGNPPNPDMNGRATCLREPVFYRATSTRGFHFYW